MIQLIKNEWIKLWAKKQSWIFLIAIVVFTFITGLIYSNFNEPHTEGTTENWEVGIQTQIEHNEEALSSGDVEQWEREMLEREQEYNQAVVDAGVNPYETNNFVFMNEVMLGVASFITLFSVIVASSIVSSELASGTIKQLVIRPFERWQFLLAKFLTVIFYSLILVITLVIVNWLVGTIFFGQGSLSAPIIERPFDGEIIQTTVGTMLLSKVGLYTLNMFMFVIISFSISTLFKSQSLAVGIGIFALFFSSMSQGFTMLLEDSVWYKFILIPHLNLQHYATHDTLMEGVTMPFSLMILAVYMILLLSITTLLFQKRDISY
ncbi:ABC transporter permease [Bacillus shivajii]|uniref:ABC transporter permease n=1 Tax=Bacillus shivajii TaxID=1983719 RepID=UPI001CFAE974|nr:ABC transporter permease subunit [Bacillus shivajii]UCZ53821.1 ABC transporter permease [Bacillus shivajii]